MVQPSFASTRHSLPGRTQRPHGAKRSVSKASERKGQEKIWTQYGIDLREQPLNSHGKRVWSDELKKQVVRALRSFPKTEISAAIGVYPTDLRQWQAVWGPQVEAEIRAEIATKQQEQRDLEQQEWEAKQQSEVEAKQESKVEDTQPSMFSNAELGLSVEDTRPSTSKTMTIPEIYEKYGIDLSKQRTTGRGRSWDAETMRPILALIESKKFPQNEVLKDLGLGWTVVVRWREELGVAAPAPARSRRPRTHGRDAAEEPEERVAAREIVKSHATEIARAKVAKRAERVERSTQYLANDDGTTRFETSSVIDAIKLLEAMRHNPEFTRVSVILSTVE